MDFIKGLHESRMTKDDGNSRKLTYSDCMERLYLCLLVLETLRQFPEFRNFVKTYTTKTAGFPTLSTPNLLVGTDVRFTFTLINKPRYTIVPGGPNNVTLQFQDPFIFAEVLYI